MTTRTISLFGALATNVVLVVFFVRALLHPADFTDFIYKTGIMIFMIEFMSLHSSGMFFGAAQKQQAGSKVMTLKLKLTLFVFYGMFIVVFAAMTGQWLGAVYFLVSLGGKVAYSKSINAEERLKPVAAGIAMLLLSTFTVVFTAGLLKKMFPFPHEVLSARPPGQSGLFIDSPQTLLVWGILYFSLMTLCEILIFRKSHGKATQTSFTSRTRPDEVPA